MIVSNEFLIKFSQDYSTINSSIKSTLNLDKSYFNIVGSSKLLYDKFKKDKKIPSIAPSFITDLDFKLTINPSYTNTSIYNFINLCTNNSFLFLSIKTYKNNFSLPWSLPNDINNLSYIYHKKSVNSWLNTLHSFQIPIDTISNIKNILNKESISIKDLIYIERIITPFITIEWSLEDIKSGTKIVDDIKYNFKQSLENDMKNGYFKLIDCLYSFNNMYVKCDITIIIDTYKKIKGKRELYKFFTDDWYRILKSDYKNNLIVNFYTKTTNPKLLSYKNDLSSLKCIGSSLSQFQILQDLIKYYPIDNDSFNIYLDNFKAFIDISTNKSWDDYESELNDSLLSFSKQFLIKHFNILSFSGNKRFSTFFYIKNNNIISNISPINTSITSSSIITKNKTPFLADRLNIDVKQLNDCLSKSISSPDILDYYNHLSRPLDHLYIYKNSQNSLFYLNGFFSENDIKFLLSNDIIDESLINDNILLGPVKIDTKKLPKVYTYLFSPIID